MTQAPPADDSNNRVVVVTLDEESIGRSGPDIEHERAIAIYDLVEQNLFAPEGAAAGPFTLHIAITGNSLTIVANRLRKLSSGPKITEGRNTVTSRLGARTIASASPLERR